MTTRLTRMLRLALSAFGRDRRGATAIEYALIAVGIGIAIATTVVAVGSSLNTNFYEKIENATSAKT